MKCLFCHQEMSYDEDICYFACHNHPLIVYGTDFGAVDVYKSYEFVFETFELHYNFSYDYKYFTLYNNLIVIWKLNYHPDITPENVSSKLFYYLSLL